MVREMAQEAEGFKTAKEGEVRKWGSPLCSDAQWHQDSGPGKFNHFLTGLSPMIPFWVSGEAEPRGWRRPRVGPAGLRGTLGPRPIL